MYMVITGVSTGVLNTRQRVSAGVLAAFRVMLLFFPLTLVHLCLHEGGHALVALFHQAPNTEIFIHPFSFAGYSRPIFDFNNVWFHLGGTISAILVALILFICLWKRRNTAALLPVMLFPWIALWEGLAIILVLGKNGDYYNLSQVSGLPAGLFVLTGVVLFVGGTFLFMSLFPRLGLAPENKNTLWAGPAIPVSLWFYRRHPR
jgi:hypothetical protein